MVVPIAAPTTPSCGRGPHPNTSAGPSTMLIAFASHSVRIAVAASPELRKTELIRNSSTTLAFPPSMTRVNDTFRITPDDAPMIPSS